MLAIVVASLFCCIISNEIKFDLMDRDTRIK